MFYKNCYIVRPNDFSVHSTDGIQNPFIGIKSSFNTEKKHTGKFTYPM
jgi:hypothetical protein